MLIRNAELDLSRRADVRVEADRVVAIADRLPAADGEEVVDARGASLLPGLHDHHLHLYATAAALRSVACGPPAVRDAAALAAVLVRAKAGADGWIRGTGYHESVAGLPDCMQLDAWVPDVPLRIQHRSGRLWLLNSTALALLDARERDPPERRDGRLTGRVYDADGWLRERIGGRWPDLHALSTQLARWGITGCTDTGQSNDGATFARFVGERACGSLMQCLRVMGDGSLDALSDAGVARGERKFHLHDHALPDFERVVAEVRRSHAVGRAAAFHCVTRGELVFALAVLREAGSCGRDRIEHAGIVPPEAIDAMRELRVRVVTQPNFIAERGDAYRRDVDAADHGRLYRLRSLLDAGVPLAAGSDAPYGDANPWRAMQAAVDRRTLDGAPLGATEALTPEQALALFLAPLDDIAAPPRAVRVGEVADLCLLQTPWSATRLRLGQTQPRRVLIGGVTVWDADHPL